MHSGLRALQGHELPQARAATKVPSAIFSLHGTMTGLVGTVLLGATLGLASTPAYGAPDKCDGALGNVTFIPFIGDLADATSQPCYPTVTINPKDAVKGGGKNAAKRRAVEESQAAAKKVVKFAGTALSDLKSPSSRHTYSRIGKKTAAKSSNTIPEPGVSMADDVAAIRSGKGKISGEEISVNGRVYKAHGGRLYPVRGAGLRTLNRGAFKALQKLKELGNSADTDKILDKMGVGDAERNAAKALYNLYN